MLETCKKQYQKVYFEHETLKRMFIGQREELIKCQNHIKNSITTNTKRQDRKINLNNTEFDENIFKNLFNVHKRKMCYVDYYSDDDDEMQREC